MSLFFTWFIFINHVVNHELVVTCYLRRFGSTQWSRLFFPFDLKLKKSQISPHCDLLIPSGVGRELTSVSISDWSIQIFTPVWVGLMAFRPIAILR